MNSKWSRESLLVILVVAMALLAIGYYGYHQLVEAEKSLAESSSRLVEEQEQILTNYLSDENDLENRQNEYNELTTYLPESEEINEALVTIESLATYQDVDVLTVSKMADQQPIETLSENFVSTRYQVEVESTEARNIRQFIRTLMDEDRMWEINTLSTQKNADNDYSGLFTIDLVFRQSD